ncbi:MAG: exonuclease SbcCD subunit D [Bryobacteraceae bacterium]
MIATHAFVAGGLESESERPLALGGAGAVTPGCFDGFCFAVLGHLHRPQSLHSDRIHYPGAPLKFAFSEADHQKSVSLVEIDARGRASTRRIPLRPRRELRCLEGYFDDLLRHSPPGVNPSDLLSITLLDSKPVLDAMNRLRQRYPNLLQLCQPALAQSTTRGVRPPNPAHFSEEDLFADFFQQVTGRALDDTERAELLAALDQLHRQEQDL